jgi:hypothetical protein
MFIKAAKYYLKTGISVIATDQNKRSLGSWKKYQTTPLTESELKDHFNSRAEGIAVICGGVSGGLEVIDIDAKYDITGTLIERIYASIEELCPDLLKTLYTVTTKGKGMHLYYRCEVVEGNMKLASRPTTEEERGRNPHEKTKVLIETRGEAGYVIAPPTPGYERTGPQEIPVLTADQRDTLLSIMRSFNEVVEQERPQRQLGAERFSVKPWEDFSERGDHRTLLEANGWHYTGSRGDNEYFRRPGKDDGVSASWHVSKKLFYCFTSSTQFEPGKAYRLSSIYAIIDHGGDFAAAAKALISRGYGQEQSNYGKIEKAVFKKKQEGYNADDLKEMVTKQYGKSGQEAAEIIDELQAKWGDNICTFWNPDKQGKPDIMHSKLIQFLTITGGFHLYFYDPGSTIFKTIRIKDGLVEEASTEQMKKFIFGYINTLPDAFDGGITPEQLMEAVSRGASTYFSDPKLEFMQHAKLDLLRDTATKAFFPFRNGIVTVDRKGASIVNYSEVKGHIWRNQVIDFPIQILSDEEIHCEYMTFLQRISGDNDERLIACMTHIGYLLHRYKDPARPWSVILAEETDNEDKGGGTGKGIFVKALSQLLKLVKLDGKTFTVDKNFALQRVSLDSQLIAVEDCDRKMDFEKFNSQLTEGSTVEKKNKDELFIEYKDSPKWIFTTNYVMNIKGNHGKRRSKTFEVSPYFGPSRTPFDEFGHLLFDDWDQDEWNRFYNFMFGCLSLYLDQGIISIDNSDKLKKKQIIQQFGEDYFEWFGDYLGCNGDKIAQIESSKSCTWAFFKDLHQDFMKTYDLDKKDYSVKRFKKALEVSTDLYGLYLIGERNRQNNGLWQYRISNQVQAKSNVVAG